MKRGRALRRRYSASRRGHGWREDEVARLRKWIADDTYEKGGAIYWKSNDRPVPMSTFKDAGIEPPAAQAKAVQESTDAFLTDYRERMKHHVPSGEELAEMRAAFGPGATVVNVITGKKTRL